MTAGEVQQRYVGIHSRLHGRTALTRPWKGRQGSWVLAQFDAAPEPYQYYNLGWHPFPASVFEAVEIDKETQE